MDLTGNLLEHTVLAVVVALALRDTEVHPVVLAA